MWSCLIEQPLRGQARWSNVPCVLYICILQSANALKTSPNDQSYEMTLFVSIRDFKPEFMDTNVKVLSVSIRELKCSSDRAKCGLSGVANLKPKLTLRDCARVDTSLRIEATT